MFNASFCFADFGDTAVSPSDRIWALGDQPLLVPFLRSASEYKRIHLRGAYSASREAFRSYFRTGELRALFDKDRTIHLVMTETIRRVDPLVCLHGRLEKSLTVLCEWSGILCGNRAQRVADDYRTWNKSVGDAVGLPSNGRVYVDTLTEYSRAEIE